MSIGPSVTCDGWPGTAGHWCMCTRPPSVCVYPCALSMTPVTFAINNIIIMIYYVCIIYRFDKLFETLQWCSHLGIKEVTVYPFSLHNFKQTQEEIDSLFEELKTFLEKR